MQYLEAIGLRQSRIVVRTSRPSIQRALTGLWAGLLACALSGVPSLVTGEEIRKDYQGFTLWIDCERKAAVRFYYHLERDVGNVERDNDFSFDPEMDRSCQQTSTATYEPRSLDFDRGHLVPFNHMDFSHEAAVETNYMVNILPQASTMNRKAWYQTELISECYREYYALDIMGGPFWSSDSRFLTSHGISVPESFWKVIRRNDDSIAWIIPNVEEATGDNLDQYIVSLEEIEKRTGQDVALDIERNYTGTLDSWDVEKCKPLKYWRK